MNNNSNGARIFVLVAVAAAALMIGAFNAGPTLAGKPGSDGGGVLRVSPDPAPYMTDTLNISGTGFGANQTLMITVAGSFPGAEAQTDGNGSFSLTWTRWGGGFSAGDHWVTVAKYQGRRSITVATEHFWVCSTNPC